MRQLKDKEKNLNDSIKIHDYTVENDSYDIYNFKETLENSAVLRKTQREGMEIMPEFSHLHQDVFDMLYKYDPKKNPEDAINYRFLLNSSVTDALFESKQYKELRHLTRLDRLASAVGTEALGEEVKDLVKTLKEEADKLAQEIADQEAAMKAMQGEEGEEGEGEGEGEAEGEGEETDEEGDPKGKGKSKKKLTLEQAQAELEKKRQELKDLVKKTNRSKIEKALEKAINKTTETTDFIQAWGMENDANFAKAGYQEKMKLLDRIRNNDKLRKIVNMSGRFKRLAVQAQREKVKVGVADIYDVTLGDEINNLLASELIKIKHKSLKKLFKIDFVERQLLVYKREDKERKQMGPIIVAIDSSGSMSGSPEIWAKSVVLGMIEIARIQKRSVYVIHFSSNQKKDLKTHTFPKNKYDNVMEIIDMAEYFESGGTLFEPPLEKARDFIEEDGEFNKADIIFVTDGESAVGDKWVKDFVAWKVKKNVKIHSILIDQYANTAVTLKLFSDTVVKVSELSSFNQDTLAIDLFRSM